jgi:hypothetical protein
MTDSSTFVSISNRALTWLGAEPITDLTDNTKEGRACNRIYQQSRDQALRDHPWNFALKRVAVAADTTAPIWKYSNAYSWPSGCLRIIEVDTLAEWVVEGRKILTDQAAPLNILYIDTIEDPTLFDAMFVEAYAARIAADLAFDLTANGTVVANAQQLYTTRLAAARLVDAQEALSADETDWLEARN